MTGKSHIAMNSASAIALSSTLSYVLTKMPVTNMVSEYVHKSGIIIKDFIITPDFTPGILSYTLCVLFYYLGTLLPDADSPNSMIGRYFHIPIKHRTWLHAIYIPVACIIGGIFFSKPLFWLGFGYYLHLFWDAPSYMGVCFLYPFSQYIEYPSGAKVKKRHKLKLYRYGDISEYIFVFVFFLLLIAYSSYLWYNGTSPIDWTLK